jgi:hypothetical protein
VFVEDNGNEEVRGTDGVKETHKEWITAGVERGLTVTCRLVKHLKSFITVFEVNK